MHQPVVLNQGVDQAEFGVGLGIEFCVNASGQPLVFQGRFAVDEHEAAQQSVSAAVAGDLFFACGAGGAGGEFGVFAVVVDLGFGG